MGLFPDKLDPAQRDLVSEALDYISRHDRGIPDGVLEKLQAFHDADTIKTKALGQRARYLQFPGLSPWIELDPQSLGLSPPYNWKKALAGCRGEQSKEILVLAKADQSRLFVAAALVHEGTHAKLGLSLRRKADELAAYRAEACFLRNVVEHEPHVLVANAARSLLNDAHRDAKNQEGVEL